MGTCTDHRGVGDPEYMASIRIPLCIASVPIPAAWKLTVFIKGPTTVYGLIDHGQIGDLDADQIRETLARIEFKGSSGGIG